MKFPVALISALLFAGVSYAQQTAQVPPTGTPQDQSPSTNPITTLAQQFLEHDFFNFFLFANGIYESEPLSINGHNVNQGGWGFDGGGGIDAYKQLRDGFVSLGYRGDYRDYSSSLFPSGTSQSLAFAYQKRLSRRWIFNFDTNAGIFL